MIHIFLRVSFGIVVGLVLTAGGCATSGQTESEKKAAAEAGAGGDPIGVRRAQIFEELRTLSPKEFPKNNPMQEILRGDEYGGALDAGRAIEFLAEGLALKALLHAQASVGADPGNTARRTLMHLISKKSGVAPDPEGELPRPALMRHELSQANTAFYEERFGEALQRARRAVLLDEDSADAWKARASAELAIGDEERAKTSFMKAAALAPEDKRLARFLLNRGWR